MKFRAILPVCLALAALAATVALAQDPHPFSVHDMLAMERIGDPQVSPDGQWVAFTVRSTDLEANRGRTDIWLATRRRQDRQAPDHRPGRRLEPALVPERQALLPLLPRRQQPDLAHRSRAAARPQQVTHLRPGRGGYEVVPQLQGFLVALEVYPGLGIEGTVEQDAEQAAAPRPPARSTTS